MINGEGLSDFTHYSLSQKLKYFPWQVKPQDLTRASLHILQIILSLHIKNKKPLYNNITIFNKKEKKRKEKKVF